MSTEDLDDEVERLLHVVPHAAPHRVAAALAANDNNPTLALDELLDLPPPEENGQEFRQYVEKKRDAILQCYRQEIHSLSSVPGNTVRQIAALLGHVQEAMRTYWASKTCVHFTDSVLALVTSVKENAQMKQVFAEPGRNRPGPLSPPPPPPRLK